MDCGVSMEIRPHREVAFVRLGQVSRCKVNFPGIRLRHCDVFHAPSLKPFVVARMCTLFVPEKES